MNTKETNKGWTKVSRLQWFQQQSWEFFVEVIISWYVSMMPAAVFVGTF
jgi:hypothetical protein